MMGNLLEQTEKGIGEVSRPQSMKELAGHRRGLDFVPGEDGCVKKVNVQKGPAYSYLWRGK